MIRSWHGSRFYGLMLLIMDSITIYGRHAVVEAVRKRADVISALYADEAFINDPKNAKHLKSIGKVEVFDMRRLPPGVDRKSVHQGYAAILDDSKLMIPFKDFKQTLVANPDTSIVILGEVQDPHNVGAIIRSAAAFGVSAVLIPKHRQAPVNGTVIKVSVGTAFPIPLVEVGNVNNALRDLKDKGFWVYGLDMEGDSSLPTEDFSRPSVFVVGNEGGGMREKTKSHCDSILTIPMHPRAESLNASVSAATVLYAWSTKHSSSLA